MDNPGQQLPDCGDRLPLLIAKPAASKTAAPIITLFVDGVFINQKPTV
jgi:hypothetical protein